MRRPARGLRHLLAWMASLAIAGCRSPETATVEPLRIAAASDLQRVLPRLVTPFQAQTGATATVTFDASGRITEQIRAGAPYDVFLSANTKYVTDLVEEGLILPDSVRPYARGSLVLCVPSSLADRVRDLKDLGRPEVRHVAIANPDYAPYGMAARQALERAGLWSSLAAKLVRAPSVRQAVAYVEGGDADAALVSKALVDVPGVSVFEVDRGLYSPLIQALGVVKDRPRRDLALAFTAFVLGEEGQAILQAGGFARPAQAADPSREAPRAPERPAAKASPGSTVMGDLDPLWLSLRVAAAATLVILLAGLPVAFWLARHRFRGKGLFTGLLVLPLVLPPSVLGYLLLQVLGRRAWPGSVLEQGLGVVLVFHWTGAVLASATAAFPLFLLPARSAFEAVDPALEDAARLLGRGELSVFWAVTLPLAWRGLAAGTVLAFARALGDFGATLMVAGNIPGLTQTASLAIYDAVQTGDGRRAAWLTLWVSLVSVTALWLVHRSLPDRGLVR